MVGMSAPRVLLVDDHAVYRGGLRGVLADEGIEIVGEAESGVAAIELVGRRDVDVVLMDCHMPRMDGVETTRRLLELRPNLIVVMVTASLDDRDLVDALIAGARGYVLKDAPTDELFEALDAALRGDAVISPRIAKRMADRLRSGGGDLRPAPDGEVELSQREIEILRLLADGHDNAAIAAQLYLSPSTVKNHVAHLLAKLGIANRTQAAVYAVRRGLI